MNHLDALEHKSIYLIREAYARYRHSALLWSIGKDSTTVLWLVRKAFFGSIPFPVVHIDTGYKFQEIYDFREHYRKVFNLDLIISKNNNALAEGMSAKKGAFECCHALKTVALQETIKAHQFKALLLGIRRDEHGLRAKERYFSPRGSDFMWQYEKQPAELWDLYKSNSPQEDHMRIHPLLHWQEIDIWRYIKRERIPVVDLYFSREGKRYRSIGCSCCCVPIDSKAHTVSQIIKELEGTDTAERSGRAQDKENAYTMQKLRSLGYM